jgi:hypothetical protein
VDGHRVHDKSKPVQRLDFRQALSCLAAEHYWDPVRWVIEEQGWRFERLRLGRPAAAVAATGET